MNIMRISNNYNQYNLNKVPTIRQQNQSEPVSQSLTFQNNYVNFYGLFSSNKKNNNIIEDNKYGLTGEDYTLSFKMADVLNRLGKDSILVIGNTNNYFIKNRVKHVITKYEDIIPDPKSLREVYLINHDSDLTMVISKNDDGTFNIHSSEGAENISRQKNKYDIDFPMKQTAQYNDVIKTSNGLKLKFLRLPETRTIMYDAKYPVEAFLSNSLELEGGLIINKSNKIDYPSDNKEIQESKLKWARPIPHRTFRDVAGLDENVELLKKKVLYPMLYPEAFRDNKNYGAILYGEPGTGKTLLALALIGEAKERKGKKIHFIKIDSNDLETNEWSGTTQHWKEVFNELKENQPSMLFIDEADSVLARRKEGHNNVPKNYVTTEFLTQIDDIEKTGANVYILGATNNPDMIDPAIKRSGRLGDLIKIEKPDEKGCLDIVNLYLNNKRVDKDFDRKEFAKKIHSLGYTGADIAEIVSEAKDAMYERCGIWDKMEKGTFKTHDLRGLKYIGEDFETALNNQKIKKKRAKIGFNNK